MGLYCQMQNTGLKCECVGACVCVHGHLLEYSLQKLVLSLYHVSAGDKVISLGLAASALLYSLNHLAVVPPPLLFRVNFLFDFLVCGTLE